MKKIILSLIAGCVLLQAGAAELNWLTDVPKAEAQAKTEGKLVLLDFTGSDWCSWCIKLDKDTFSQPAFAEYAQKNLVLVQLDYPDKKPQSAELKSANAALKAKYAIEGFPTLIALKPDGTVVWKQVGYLPGGPKTFIAELDKAKGK